MAETFKNQVDALTGFAGTEDDALTDWLTAGAKEIINILPYNLKEKCTTETTLNNSSPTMDMDGVGEILYVNRLSADSGGSRIPCRRIPSMYGELVNDSNSIYKASVTDPVYWILSSGDASILNVIPTPTSNQTAIVYHVGYPTVAHGDGGSGIANFPDEAEYLVVLYASVKALQRLMNNLMTNSDIDTTAFEAINTEIDDALGVADTMHTTLGSAISEITLAKTEAAEIATQTDNSGDFETALDAISTAVGKFRADGSDPALFGDDSTYDTSSSEMTRVKDALDKARNLIDGATMSGDTEPESVQYWLNDEDTEMVQATLATAQTEIQREQTHMAEWSSTVQALQAEITGFATEVQSRAAFTGAKGQAVQSYVSTANTNLQIAQGYASQIQIRLATAQAYIGEANTRMQRDSQKYQWYQGQQLKLQQDYDKGIQMLVAQGIPQQAQQGAR